MRELSLIFTTVAGTAIGYLVGREPGAMIGTGISLTAHVIVSHLPPFLYGGQDKREP